MHPLVAPRSGDRAGYRASEKTSVIAVTHVTLDPCQAAIRVLAIIDYCLWLRV